MHVDTHCAIGRINLKPLAPPFRVLEEDPGIRDEAKALDYLRQCFAVGPGTMRALAVTGERYVTIVDRVVREGDMRPYYSLESEAWQKFWSGFFAYARSTLPPEDVSPDPHLRLFIRRPPTLRWRGINSFQVSGRFLISEKPDLTQDAA